MTPSLSADPVIENFAKESQPVVAEVPATPISEPAKVEDPKTEAPVPVVQEEKKNEVAPIVENAKPDTAPVEIPKIVEATPIDMEKIFSEASNGKIKSAAELSKILQEHNEFKERIAQSPELDDYTIKLNSWIKKGHDPELFHKINKLPLDEMSAEETMKVSLSLANPTWTQEDVDLYVKDTYGLVSEGEEGYSEQKARVGKLRLQQDARTHEQNLRKLQEMTVYSNVDEQEAIKVEGTRQETWKQSLPKIVNDINVIPFPVDDKGAVFNWVPTPLQRQAVIAAVQSAVLNAPVAYDEQGIKSVTSLIQREFINQNINQIALSIAKQQKSADIKEAIVETHNPSGAITPVVDPPKIEKSRDDVIFDAAFATVSGRR